MHPAGSGRAGRGVEADCAEAVRGEGVTGISGEGVRFHNAGTRIGLQRRLPGTLRPIRGDAGGFAGETKDTGMLASEARLIRQSEGLGVGVSELAPKV
jgi:hypothetical protein